MQGRGRGRGGRSHFGRGHHGKSSSKFNSNNKSSKPVKTKLEDHVFHLGTARQASDYETNVKFILNHIQEEFGKYGNDIVKALKDLKYEIVENWEPDHTKYIATNEDEEARKRAQHVLDIKLKNAIGEYFERKHAYSSNKFKAYALIWKRCSPQMQSQLESRDNYSTTIENDPVELPKAIKQHALNYREHR